MIMTPTPRYSPHDLVTPWSHEPLPLALPCCAFLQCWSAVPFTVLVLGVRPYKSVSDMTHRVVLDLLSTTRKVRGGFSPLSFPQQENTWGEDDEGAMLCPGTKTHLQCHYSPFCQQRQCLQHCHFLAFINLLCSPPREVL